MAAELYTIRMEDILELLQRKAAHWETQKEGEGNYISDAIAELKAGKREAAIKILDDHADNCLTMAAIQLDPGLHGEPPNVAGSEYELDECDRVQQMADFLRNQQ